MQNIFEKKSNFFRYISDFGKTLLDTGKTISNIAKTMSDFIQTMSDMIKIIWLIVLWCLDLKKALFGAEKTRCEMLKTPPHLI